MKLIAFIVLMLLCTSTGYGKDIVNMQENEIKNLYAKMYSYMINKDISSLGQLLDESFVLVHMTGMRQSKREYLNAIANRTLNYFSEKPENVSSVKAVLMLLYSEAGSILGGLNSIST